MLSYKILSSQKKISFNISTDGTIKNGTLSIFRKNPSSSKPIFKSLETPNKSITTFPITIYNISFKKDQAMEDTLMATSQVALVGISILTVLSFPGSAHIGLMLIKAIQIFDFFSFINVKQPSNLVAFLSIFNDNILNILPNPVA